MINEDQIRHTNDWLRQFRSLYMEGFPVRLHSRELDASGNPRHSPEMEKWLTSAEQRHHEDEPGKVRIKRAMKRLRNRSMFEYMVLYRVMVLGQSIAAVTEWMNERAERGGRTERYTTAHTATIVFAAVDKLYAWY